VHDSGIGIAPDQCERIFDEFVRLPGADGASPRGLGLGLAIVKKKAELLSHPVRVRSTPGRGSMFEISVGLMSAAASRMAPAPIAGTGARGLHGALVLVVDDDEGNRDALQTLCTSWGCDVAAATSLESALEALAQRGRPPDIVLSDLQLGDGADGLELVSRLRQQLERDIPCLLITADTTASVLDRATAARVEVLHKPAAADRILAAVRDLLNGG
jgi:two-component system, sensor histidine kinase